MPTSSQCYAVAQVFRDAVKKYPHLRLNMCCINVNTENHVCGTVHCHGGVYGLMKCDLSKVVYYEDGAEQMAIDLGFSSMDDLESWAEDNPALWGRENGGWMFTSRMAFYHPTKRPKGAEHVLHIADQWEEVGDRIKATEQPVYVNITRELAILPVEEISDVKIQQYANKN